MSKSGCPLCCSAAVPHYRPTCSVEAMEFVTSVQLADHVLPGKPLTISKAALLLSAYPNRTCWTHESEYKMLCDALTAAKKEAAEAEKANSSSSDQQTLRSDPRQLPPEWPEGSGSVSYGSDGRGKIKIYTDYQLIVDLVAKEEVDRGIDPFCSRFDFVNDRSEADYLLIMEHVKDYLNLPPRQRVCQFPFEGGIVRKDLLPLTVRKFCYRNNRSNYSNSEHEGKENVPPYWWLPCYDLSTEFHSFAWEYERNDSQRRLEASDAHSNDWIVKPAQMAQGRGHQVFPQETTCLKDVAHFLLQSSGLSSSSSDDRVAQKLVRKPALIRGRKMDLRIAIVVRSFQAPFEAYMSKYFYARLANNVYDESKLTDPEIVLTVNAYNENESVASKQERESYEGLAIALGLDDYIIDERNGQKVQRFKLLEDSIVKVMSHLFSGAGKSIGIWPRSSAYYCVDVILDWNYCDTDRSSSFSNSEFDLCDDMFTTEWFRKVNIPVPKLVEVNYMGDLHAFEVAMQSLPPYGPKSITAFHKWTADLINCTVSDEHNPKGFIPLTDYFA